MLEQKIISGFEASNKLGEILNQSRGHKFMLVCDSAFRFLKISEVVAKLSKKIILFNDFTPNPLYEDVCKGVSVFRENECDAVVAIGGGSAIDVAKCIKLFSILSPEKNYLQQPFTHSNIPFVAIPTTAGTGSESTHFAVIYFEGRKISVAHESVLPDCVVLDHSLLKTLPIYQKKCTMLDALCHGIESWWSVNSTDDSLEFSKVAVEKIIQYKDEYLKGDEHAAAQILLAANRAGKAINITKTTAAHAMSYKLTSMYDIPHGHAAAVCLPKIWQFMYKHLDKCKDKRGEQYLKNIFSDIANTFGENEIENGIKRFELLLEDLQIKAPSISESDLKVLVSSVNTERLQNNPVNLNELDLLSLYSELMRGA